MDGQNPAPQQQPVAPAAAPAAAAQNPGQGLGIASLVCSLLGVSLVGLILGIMGLKKSKAVGMSNGMALAGVIISAIGMVFGLLWFVIWVVALVAGGTTTSTYDYSMLQVFLG